MSPVLSDVARALFNNLQPSTHDSTWWPRIDSAQKSKIESEVVKEVHNSTDQMGAKEILALMVDLPDTILPCLYEKARTGARSVVHNVVEQIRFGLLRRKC